MSDTLAVVILNWNGKSWLEKFLPTVIRHSAKAKVYVIDNASTDDSILYLQKYFPEVQIVVNATNAGFAAGYNLGLQHIEAEYYCLLNSDVEVTEGWLEPVLNLFKSDRFIAAIQPKVLDYHQKDQFEFAGAAGGLIDNLGFPYCRGRIFENIEKDEGQYNSNAQIFWASGCCLFIRSQEFLEMGGFDERFFAHQEEIDLCWRLQNAGKKIYYCADSTVYHVGGGTLTKQNPRKTYLNIRNNLSMLAKNLPADKLFPVIFSRLVLDAFTAFYFGLKLGPKHFIAVLKGHFGFYRMLPGNIKRRQKKQITHYYSEKWLVFKSFLGK